MSEPHATGQARIFKSDFVESLTKTTPLISVLVYGPAIAGLLYVAISIKELPVATTMKWFGFALLFWTFAEYFLHRYLFHFITEAEWTKRFHFVVHGSHHVYPRDQERLLMPPVPGLILASILFSIFYIFFWISGRPDLTWAFFPGFFLGYLLYSFMHYAIHTYKPPSFLKGLWLHHNVHHYQDNQRAFGVSSPLWDRIFGTMPEKKR
jgi:sterol desaturase/sphingolipid hydroxylase (fatty acid hydroxylase superfamily)